MSYENKREYFRLDLQVPISALLKIIAVRNDLTNSNFSKIVIRDISAGGVKIHCRLDMPININLLLEFSFQLFTEELKLIGVIARKNQISPTLYEYGIKFYLDPVKESSLMKHLNLLSARLKNSSIFTSCSFCSDEELEQFYTPLEAENLLAAPADKA